MLKVGSIVILTKDGAQEVMRRWSAGHPFHSLAKFLKTHSDTRVLIKNGYEDKYDITISPDTFERYRKEVKGMSLHLSNWEGCWFTFESCLQLSKPKYRLEQVVIVKDYEKYVRVKIKEIVALWNYGYVIINSKPEQKPCVFCGWGYTVEFEDHHFQYPYPEDSVTPTLKNRQEEKGQVDWREIFTAKGGG